MAEQETGLDEPEIIIEYYGNIEKDPIKQEDNTLDDIQVSDDNLSMNTPENHVQKAETKWYKEIDALGRFICRFCDLTYSTVQTLRHHIKIKHKEEGNEIKPQILTNKRNSKLKCHVCHLKYKDLLLLKEHVEKDHDLTYLQLSCSFCDASFSSQKCLMDHFFYEHKKTHSKVFICILCGYRTLKRSHYRQHKNTHLIEKSFKCGSCDYSTNYLPNLNTHEKIHSDFKPYSCSYEGCNYRGAAKSALKSHLLKHYPQENVLFCEKCSYKTVYKQSLRKHLNSHQRNMINIKL